MRKSRSRLGQRIHWHASTYEPLEQRLVLASVQFRFELTDTGGTPIDLIHVGQDFLLKTYVQDIRPTPEGVFQAYLDVSYPSALATPNGAIVHGSDYTLVPSGDTATAGLINEVGGQDSDTVAPSPQGAELLLFTVPFHADATGPFDVTGDVADSVSHWIVMFDSATQVPLSSLSFVGGSAEIVEANESPTLSTINTLTGALEDQPFAIDYATLAGASNAADPEGDPISFRVESVTRGTLTKDGAPVVQGVTLLSSGESLLWTPDGNANGTLEAFSVKAFDGHSASSTAVGVVVDVGPVNDPPSFTKGADIWDTTGGSHVVSAWATGISAGPSDESSQSLNFIVTTDNDALFSVAPAIDSAGNLTFTFAASARGVAIVTVMLADNGGTANGGQDTSAAQEFYISIDDQAHFWHNADNPLDVDRNGAIENHDRLLVVNELLRNGVHTFPADPSPPDVPPPFWDVDDSGYIAAHDSLLLVNYLLNPPTQLSPLNAAAGAESLTVSPQLADDSRPSVADGTKSDQNRDVQTAAAADALLATLAPSSSATMFGALAAHCARQADADSQPAATRAADMVFASASDGARPTWAARPAAHRFDPPNCQPGGTESADAATLFEF